MFGIILYDILFFGIPIAALLFFGIALYRYLAAKRRAEDFDPQQIRTRKALLIAASAIVGVLLFSVIGVAALLFAAVAFM